MISSAGQFIRFGLHGCDRPVAETLLTGTRSRPAKTIRIGSDPVFIFGKPIRSGASSSHVNGNAREKIADPYVVGAVIELGFCLDLISSNGVAAVKSAYEDFRAYAEQAGNVSLPKNRGGEDKLRRELDCAVINHLHNVRHVAALPRFDSVRGVFIEGARIYPQFRLL